MDWSKVKNIIILFLISINIFLIIVMGITTFQENYIPGEVLDAAVKVMKNDGFICDKAILPDTYKKATVLKAEFYSASELSEIFFGDQVPFRTKKNTLIACIVRDNEVISPRGKDVLLAGDTVVVVTTNTGYREINDILEKK